jgi:RND family efflux transporter MFP subunit
VEAARNRLKLAQAEHRRMEAMVGYARITAPFAGVVTDRNVDPGHLLQPPSGSGSALPLFVVSRTDKVRVFLEVPETDAVLVRKGALGHIRVQVLNDEEFEGEVAGDSFSLEPNQRTLKTEMDFLNPKGKLRPGMYAHAIVRAQQPGAITIPALAVLTRDGQTFCYLAVDGKAVRTAIKTGARAGAMLEVVKKERPPSKPGEPARWVNFTGQEDVITTNPRELGNGQPIRVMPSTEVPG